MPLTFWEKQMLVATLAWVCGFLPLILGLRREWRWWHAVGFALVLSPFIRMGVGTVEGLSLLLHTTLTGGYVVHAAYTPEFLWGKFWRHGLFYLVLPAAGLALLWEGRTTRFNLGRVGIHTREGVGRDALHGFALFFIILAAYLGAFFLTYVILKDVLVSTASEAALWQNMTPLLILLLSCVAGVSEEFLFRGVLLSTLSRRMSWGAAAILQAVLFGLVHSGYLTWAHVLGPALFGLGMAVVTRVLGIIPAILLHVQINVVFFSVEVLSVQPGAWWLLAAFAAVNVWAAYATRLAAVPALWAWLRGRGAAAGSTPVEVKAREAPLRP